MSNNHPYGGGYEGDGFTNFMHEDEWLYDLVEKYCQLFKYLDAKEQLAKLKMIFNMAPKKGGHKGVHEGVPYSTNRNSVCIHIKYLCETIYENRRLAKHPDDRKLQRYLPQYLLNDEWLMEKITGYTPPREKRNTFAVKIMHQRNVDGGDERGQHIIFLPIPDDLAASEAAADWKLLQKVCREMR